MAWLKPFDLNRFLRDTPLFLKATTILVLLGAIFLGSLAITGAIWNGREFRWLGLFIQAKQDPQTQRCTTLAGVQQNLSSDRQTSLDKIRSAIAAAQKSLENNERQLYAALGGPTLASQQQVYRDAVKRDSDGIKRLSGQEADILIKGQKNQDDIVRNCGPGG